MSPLIPPHRLPPLPRVPGPKLGPFTANGHADIKFIKKLGTSANKDSHVWQVEIDGKPYALKMFEFSHWKYLVDAPAKYLNRTLSRRQFYIDYFDPFCCECRVYGRLQEEGRQDLAIRAHGYLLLTSKQEAEVTRRIDGVDYEKPDQDETKLIGDKTWGRYEQHRGQPVQAIVKDLVTGDGSAFEVEQIPGMWSDLKSLHALGILVRDIHIGNYLNGKLVDFSRAWTMYHPCLDEGKLPLGGLKRHRRKDPLQFESMIDDDYGYDVKEVPEELHECAAGQHNYGVDQTLYKWWERGGETARRHVEEELYGELESGDDD